MVFQSAHYKRQEDDDLENNSMSEAAAQASIIKNQATTIHLPSETPQVGGGLSSAGIHSFEEDNNLIGGLASSDHLCEPPDDGGGGGAGGRVRFVNSTVRYHMASGAAQTLWTGRTSLEKILMVLVTGLILTVSVLFIVIGKEEETVTEIQKSDSKYCLSSECVKVAAAIISDLDDETDPCDDFYKHACGGWEKLNPIPDGHSSWSIFEKILEGNQLVMKNVLENATSIKDDTKSEGVNTDAKRKAHNYYTSCMDPNGTIESLGGKPLLEMLRTHLVGWHLLQRLPPPTAPAGDPTELSQQDQGHEDQDEKDVVKNFTAKVAMVHHDLHSEGFFTWLVGEDDHNSSLHVIQVDQGGLTLPNREHYLSTNDTKIVDALKAIMFRHIMLLIKDDTPEEDASADMPIIDAQWKQRIREEINLVVEFETRLANITIPADRKREDSGSSSRKNMGELGQDLTFLNWTAYFQNAFDRINHSISNETEVVVYGSRYLQGLSELIWEYQNTTQGRRTLDSYMKWHVIKFARSALSEPYRDAGKILEKALLGKEGHTERWRECVSDTDVALGYALGAMFVRHVFHRESKEEAQGMIDSIKMAFEHRLGTLKWMDDTTREAALVKAQAISDMIGYPSFIEDETALDAKYSDLKIDPNDYFGNGMASRNFGFLDNMRKLEKLVNRTKWSMTPPTVNAYYTPTKNQIVFPAGILQSPFFNVRYPKSINYGAMGVVMGHELSHAFDDQGREYDEIGNMRNWWNNATLVQFKFRTKCIEDQYSGYRVLAQNVSGSLTLGENIADNGGLQTAYYAYKAWLKKQDFDQEQPLPGLKHTHDQLFFLSFAQVWCSAATPQAKKTTTSGGSSLTCKIPRYRGPVQLKRICQSLQLSAKVPHESNTQMPSMVIIFLEKG